VIQALYYLFFAVSTYLLIRSKSEFIYLIPLFNVISDTSFNYFLGFSAPTFLRAGILTLFLIYAYPYYKGKTIGKPFYWFFLYVIIMTISSGEFAYSLKGSYQVIVSMALFMTGYGLINCYSRLKRLMKALYWVIIFSVVITALGYLFNIGQALEYTTDSTYEGGPENVGLLGSGGLYTPAVLLILFPFFLKMHFGLMKKWVLYASMLILYIFIILNVRRTAILIPIVGSIGFLLYSNFRRKYIQYLLIGGSLLILLFPLYSSYFMRRYEARENSGRFEEDFYKTEARYIENVEMVESITTFKEPFKVLFGVGNNIFAEHVENNEIARRMFHSDSAKLFYGVGLFGIFLYLAIFVRLIWEILKIPARGILKDLKSAALGLVLILLFVSLNGSVNLITFRSVTFLLLGSFIGFAHSIMKTNGRVLAE